MISASDPLRTLECGDERDRVMDREQNVGCGNGELDAMRLPVPVEEGGHIDG